MKKLLLMLVAVAGVSTVIHAQEVEKKNVRDADIMYKKTLVRAIDLRERQNKPMFSKNNEITKFLIEAVRNGKITAYANDSLTGKLDVDQFMSKMILPSSQPIVTDTQELMIMYPDTWREMLANPPKPEYYFARDLYQMEVKEEIYFNDAKSRMEYNIYALTVYIPADHPSNIKGIQETVASFSYPELKKLFQDSPNALWYNMQNEQQHKNLADAFELRLFSSYIIKVGNADDLYLSDMYKDQQTGIMASSWAANELLEFEHHLWEY